MATAPRATEHRIGRGVLVAFVAGVVAIGVALGLLLTQGTNQIAPVAAQLASVQAGCTQWLAAKPAPAGTGQWCTEMTSWMSQYMERSDVGPQMMWGDSDHMLSACEQWITTSPPSGSAAPPQTWCNSMVSWMTSHMSTWSGHDT